MNQSERKTQQVPEQKVKSTLKVVDFPPVKDRVVNSESRFETHNVDKQTGVLT